MAAAIGLFWIVFWFTRSELAPHVVDFEINFIVPDLFWVLGLLICSSRWLMAGDPRGLWTSAAAGGALVFLGLLDAGFNMRHGGYSSDPGVGMLNVLINAGCIGYGIWNIVLIARYANSVQGKHYDQ